LSFISRLASAFSSDEGPSSPSRCVTDRGTSVRSPFTDSDKVSSSRSSTGEVVHSVETGRGRAGSPNPTPLAIVPGIGAAVNSGTGLAAPTEAGVERVVRGEGVGE